MQVKFFDHPVRVLDVDFSTFRIEVVAQNYRKHNNSVPPLIRPFNLNIKCF